jgi:hypothetical protein
MSSSPANLQGRILGKKSVSYAKIYRDIITAEGVEIAARTVLPARASAYVV